MWTATPAYNLRLILNSALWLTAAGIMVRGCGAVKEIAFAASFGVSRYTDQFLLAATYSAFIPSVLASAITTALIAQLARLRAGPAFVAGRPLAALAWGIFWCGALACVVTYVCAPSGMSFFFNLTGNDLDHAVRFARILAPLSLTMIISASLSALLNSAKQFVVAGLSAAATPLVMIIAIVGAKERGVDAAAWGMVTGGVLEVGVLAFTIIRQRRALFTHGAAAPETLQIVRFWRGVSFLALSAGLAAVSPLIDQVFLSKLEVGAITAFNYASKVNSLLIGLFGTAFGVAMFPYLTDLVAERDLSALKHLSWRIIRLVVPITAVASTLVLLFSHEIVQALFARGSFTDEDTYVVANLQRVFAFQLVFYVAGLVAMRVLNALGAADLVLWVSCVGVVVNAVLDWLFYEQLAAAGIALSSVLTSVASLCAAVLFIRAGIRRHSSGA